ncbi:MAG: CobW family GTP-binding protein [Shewanella sp.]
MIVKAIPTNIITGFLGVGKTTLIKQLLASKPEGETWAVLVNEFGEVGIDAGLLANPNPTIHIREVAGGCMCCAAGVPTQVAINQLIARAKPDRLLIEPTGLGHPNEIIKLLSAPHYQQVIALCHTFCLVDARKIFDARYRQHAHFREQLQVADIVIATKSDKYDAIPAVDAAQLYAELRRFLDALGSKDVQVIPHSALQDVPLEIVTHLEQARRQRFSPPPSSLLSPRRDVSQDITETGLFAMAASEALELDVPFIRQQQQSQGAVSCGWRFSPTQEFDFDKLMAFVRQQTAPDRWRGTLLRLKAVMITTDGIAAVNWIEDECQLAELDDAVDSRLEIIATEVLDWDAIERQLMACLA